MYSINKVYKNDNDLLYITKYFDVIGIFNIKCMYIFS